MLWTKRSIGRMNNIHKRCLPLIQQSYTSDIEICLEDANKKPMHQMWIELLMTEIYKYLNGLTPDIMITILKLRPKW